MRQMKGFMFLIGNPEHIALTVNILLSKWLATKGAIQIVVFTLHSLL